jgi:hypothetical protein
MAPKPATRASPRNQIAKGASDAAAPEQSVPASSASSQKATTHGKKRLAVAGGGEVPPGNSAVFSQGVSAEVLLSSSPPIINPFRSETAYISLAELSAANLWQFVSANCPASVSVFQSQWLEKQIDGPMLLRFVPSTFDREMLKEFPGMSVSIRVALFNFLKKMVARDVLASHALKFYVDPTLGQLWADSTFDGPAGKALSFDVPSTVSKHSNS